MKPPSTRPPEETLNARPGQGAATPTGRFLAPDLARGFMLLLIAMAYAPLYLEGRESGLNYHLLGGDSLDRLTNFLYLVLLDNRSYPMFAALFGYGLVMVVSRSRAAGTDDASARRLLRRRGLLLLLFGFAHGMLVFPGEILGAYGLATLALGWLMFRPERTLLRATAVLTPLFVLLVPMFTLAASSFMYGAGPVVPGYSATELVERLVSYPIAPVFSLVAYPTAIALLLGAWAARRGLLADPAAHRTLLGRVAGIGITVSVLGGLPAGLVAAELWQTTSLVSGLLMAVQVLTGLCGGLGYGALFGLISARLGERRGPLPRALAATGARSLTFYLFNSVVLALVLSPTFLGAQAYVHSAGAALVAIVVWATGVALAVLLERSGRPGPADALLRRLVNRGRTR